MKRSFVKHFMIIGGGTVLNMLLGVLTTPIITRIVDPVEYGQLSIFTMYSTIAIMVLCLGLDQALVRYYYDGDDISYKRGLLLKCVGLPVILTLAASAVVVAISALNIYEFEFGTFVMVLLCVFTLIKIIYRFSLLTVRLEYNSKIYSALNILHKVSYIALTLPMILLIKREYLMILIFATIGAEFICMAGSIFAQKNVWHFTRTSWHECGISTKELVKYAYPFIISMGITSIFQAIDKISLNMYRSYYEVGIYSSTMNLIHVFAIIQSTFNTLWAPMAVEHYSKDKEDKSFYMHGNSVITVVMFFIGISLILIKDVFAVLLGAKYREAAYILPFLIFNPIMYTISETTVSGLVFAKKSKMQVVVAAVSCVTNIVGNTLLVPKYGCQGAAISTGFSYIVFFTMRTLLSQRYFKVDFKLGRFYTLTAVVAVYALYNTFVKFNVFSVVGYLLCAAVLVVLYRETIVWCIGYVFDMLKSIPEKLKRKNG